MNLMFEKKEGNTKQVIAKLIKIDSNGVCTTQNCDGDFYKVEASEILAIESNLPLVILRALKKSTLDDYQKLLHEELELIEALKEHLDDLPF